MTLSDWKLYHFFWLLVLGVISAGTFAIFCAVYNIPTWVGFIGALVVGMSTSSTRSNDE